MVPPSLLPSNRQYSRVVKPTDYRLTQPLEQPLLVVADAGASARALGDQRARDPDVARLSRKAGWRRSVCGSITTRGA